MTLRQLRYFAVLGEELNYRRAAGRLFITQPALSTAIKQLEHQLGVMLFTRSTREVTLTELGQAWLPKVRDALRGIDAAVDDLIALSAHYRRIRLGYLIGTGADLLFRLMRHFEAVHPEIAVEPREFDFSDPTAGLADGTTEVAIIRPPVDLPEHVWRHVSHKRRSPTYVVLGLACLSTILLLSALVSEKAFTYILGIAASEARISIFDTGFGHSDLTYTVAHVWHGNIFRIGDHLDRLLDGAAKLRLDPGYTKGELAEITKRCVSLSQLRESFVNLTVTRGYGKRKGEKDLSKLTHQVYIYAIPYLWAFPPQEQIFGTTAIVPRHVRRAGRNTVDPTIKNYQWGDLTAASFEAKDRGARTAILMDADNCVAEGPGFNVVIVKDGKIASPSRNALPGITRKTVFEIADAMGIEATLRDVTSRELYDADELIAVTTAGGVTPIVSLDGEELGDGTPGPLTVAIRDRFWALMDEPSELIEPIEY